MLTAAFKDTKPGEHLWRTVENFFNSAIRLVKMLAPARGSLHKSQEGLIS